MGYYLELLTSNIGTSCLPRGIWTLTSTLYSVRVVLTVTPPRLFWHASTTAYSICVESLPIAMSLVVLIVFRSLS